LKAMKKFFRGLWFRIEFGNKSYTQIEKCKELATRYPISSLELDSIKYRMDDTYSKFKSMSENNKWVFIEANLKLAFAAGRSLEPTIHENWCQGVMYDYT